MTDQEKVVQYLLLRGPVTPWQLEENPPPELTGEQARCASQVLLKSGMLRLRHHDLKLEVRSGKVVPDLERTVWDYMLKND